MCAIYPAQESVAEIPNTPPQMGPGGDTSWPRLRTYFINSPLDSQIFLRIFRPDSPFTRYSFSRAQPASTRKSLIFLHPHTAARPAPSDNGQSVKLGSRLRENGASAPFTGRSRSARSHPGLCQNRARLLPPGRSVRPVLFSHSGGPIVPTGSRCISALSACYEKGQ